MKVFISWSKPTSRKVAAELRTWLKLVIQTLDPWMSQVDIDSGKKWSREIERQLAESKVGIVCVTRDNTKEPWLLFESGAIAKYTDENTQLIPYLLNLKKSDLGTPLSQFQVEEADREGTFHMLTSLNKNMPTPLDEPTLKATFDAFWPRLETRLKEIADEAEKATASGPPKIRKQDDVWDEMLTILRRLDANDRSRPISITRATGMTGPNAMWTSEVSRPGPGFSVPMSELAKLHDVVDSLLADSNGKAKALDRIAVAARELGITQVQLLSELYRVFPGTASRLADR